MTEARPTIHAIHLGRTDYKWCWDLQQKLLDLRAANSISDVLLLTEHEPVYTIGRGGDANHLLANDSELQARGVEVYSIDRGGDVTWHGPGQLVGYPILDLHHHYLDLHRYLRDIEEVIIRTLERFGVEGKRIPEYTGVWVDNDKICAIGIKSSRWITMHGFALNVAPDLSFFDRIIPCGIFEKGVTSISAVLGVPVDMEEVMRVLLHEFGTVFGPDIRISTLDEILPPEKPHSMIPHEMSGVLFHSSS
jgi:lipoate-protein ligase B